MTFFDKYLPNVPNFALTWATFLGAGCVLILFNVIRYRKIMSLNDMFHMCIPFNPVKSKSFHADLKIKIIRKLLDRILIIPEAVVIALVGGVFAAGMEAVAGSGPHYELTNLSALACSIAFIVAIEFGYYVNHYVHHKVPFFWELHKVHHSAPELNPLTDSRSHMLSTFSKSLITGGVVGFPAGVMMYFYKIDVPEMVLITGVTIEVLKFATLYALKHSHFPLGFGPLDWVIVSPHMHQVHHSLAKEHWDTNLGINLSIFDWIFGTGFRPKRGEKLAFGISQEAEGGSQRFETLWDLYVVPLQKSFGRLARSSRRDRAIGDGYRIADHDQHRA